MSKRRKKRRGPAGFGSSFPFLGLLQHAAAVFGGRTLLTEAQTPSASLQTLKEAISPPQNSRREHSFDVLLVKGLRMGINIIRCFMALLVCLFVCLFVCLLVCLFVCLFVRFFFVCVFLEIAQPFHKFQLASETNFLSTNHGSCRSSCLRVMLSDLNLTSFHIFSS